MGQGPAPLCRALGVGRTQAGSQLTRLSPQFEYMAQHLVFANCIPLILKFFNQNIMSYITAKNR